MTHRRFAPQLGDHAGWHSPQVALPCVELTKGIADVNAVDLGWLQSSRKQCPFDGLLGEVADVKTLPL